MVLRSALTAAALAATVGLTACGDKATTATPSAAPTSATAAAAAATFNDADVHFATDMIPHHRQAVTMADHAAGRAGSAQVKQLAAAIKGAQGPEIQKMSAWLAAWGRPAPSAAPSTGHGMPGMGTMPGMMSDADLAKLMAAKGAVFDRMFLTMMIRHHEGAVTMATDEQAKGSNPDARQLAGQIISAQTAEITRMKQMLAAL
ncbi:DUF305 domain-containing protein [Pilimelia terevasa]|nr:DUF305 domain-containing protein [Pilimelia terevasa]